MAALIKFSLNCILEIAEAAFPMLIIWCQHTCEIQLAVHIIFALRFRIQRVRAHSRADREQPQRRDEATEETARVSGPGWNFSLNISHFQFIALSALFKFDCVRCRAPLPRARRLPLQSQWWRRTWWRDSRYTKPNQTKPNQTKPNQTCKTWW